MKKTVLHNYFFLFMAVFCLLFTACGQVDNPNPIGTGEPSASATETRGSSGKSEVAETENPADNDKGTVSFRMAYGEV